MSKRNLNPHRGTTLEVKNIVCGYSKFRLKGVTFRAPKGEFTGIIGPNGSGKTTLFKGITSDLNLSSGSVNLNGVELSTLSNIARAKMIAVVTQKIEVSDITVEEYVVMGRLPYRKPFQFFESVEEYEIAYKYMRLTDTYKFKDKQMSNLSGGEQQLVAIARALTQEAGIILLDEPTSHLDITHQIAILNLLHRLNRELNITVVIILHDLNLAGEFCDNIVMFNSGTVHTSGTPEEVLTYKNIEEVYKTVVVTGTNPISGKPTILTVSERALK